MNILKITTSVLLLLAVQIAVCQEDTSYPRRASYFSFNESSKTTTGTRDSFDINNIIPLETEGTNHFYTTDRNNINGGAIHITNFSSHKEMSKGRTFNINHTGFSLAFWVKYPYSTENPDQVVNIFNLRKDNKDLWKCSITPDRSVAVSRYTNKPNGMNQMWNLKFWEPPFANINKYVTDNGPNAWFFIMIVQELDQVRLHVGMPDGKFDCMYLNYGTADQGFPYYNNSTSPKDVEIDLFPVSTELYLDDLSFWEVPLCRAEAFGFFRDIFSPSPGNDKYPFYSSSESVEIHKDDSARMYGFRPPCMSAPPAAIAARLGEPLQAELNSPANVETAKAEPNIVIYPNPASDRITIDFGKGFSTENSIQAQLYDMSGKLVAQKQFALGKGQSTIVWDGLQHNRITTGLYVLRLTTAGRQYSAKLALACGCGN